MSKRLEIMGPALRLVYKYLGQPDLPDAEKMSFAGELLRLVGEHQQETQQEVRAAIDAAGIRLDAATLLRQAVALLVREMMVEPAHAVAIADGIAGITDSTEGLSIAAVQARMDVKSARQRVVSDAALSSLYVEHDRIETGDWTAEDDRLVLIGRIADVIETMPIGQLERVLEAAKGIRMSDFRYWQHASSGALYVLRPLPGEDPHAWRARHMRQTLTSSGKPVTIRLPTAEPYESEDFMLLDDLPPEYRDVVDE